MSIITKSSNKQIDAFWEEPQVTNSDQIKVVDGWYVFTLLENLLRKGVRRAELRKVFKNWKDALTLRMAFTMEILTDETAKGSAVIFQLWDGGSPSNSIQWRYDNNEIFYRQSRGNLPTINETLFKAKKGQPLRVVIMIDGREDDRGRTQIYVGEKKVVDLKGRNLYEKIENSYPKIGLYDDDNWPSGLQSRSIRFKDIVFGDANSTFEELYEAFSDVSSQDPGKETEIPQSPEPSMAIIAAIQEMEANMENLTRRISEHEQGVLESKKTVAELKQSVNHLKSLVSS